MAYATMNELEKRADRAALLNVLRVACERSGIQAPGEGVLERIADDLADQGAVLMPVRFGTEIYRVSRITRMSYAKEKRKSVSYWRTTKIVFTPMLMEKVASEWGTTYFRHYGEAMSAARAMNESEGMTDG